MNEIEDKWRLRAVELGPRELGTRLWREFQEALLCLGEGDQESVEAWLEEKETQFIARYEGVEAKGHSQTSKDLSKRAQAAQSLFLEGVESWLEAFVALREKEAHQVILEKAEWGQRLLIAVQMLKKEESDSGVALEVWGF